MTLPGPMREFLRLVRGLDENPVAVLASPTRRGGWRALLAFVLLAWSALMASIAIVAGVGGGDALKATVVGIAEFDVLAMILVCAGVSAIVWAPLAMQILHADLRRSNLLADLALTPMAAGEIAFGALFPGARLALTAAAASQLAMGVYFTGIVERSGPTLLPILGSFMATCATVAAMANHAGVLMRERWPIFSIFASTARTLLQFMLWGFMMVMAYGLSFDWARDLTPYRDFREGIGVGLAGAFAFLMASSAMANALPALGEGYMRDVLPELHLRHDWWAMEWFSFRNRRVLPASAVGAPPWRSKLRDACIAFCVCAVAHAVLSLRHLGAGTVPLAFQDSGMSAYLVACMAMSVLLVVWLRRHTWVLVAGNLRTSLAGPLIPSSVVLALFAYFGTVGGDVWSLAPDDWTLRGVLAAALGLAFRLACLAGFFYVVWIASTLLAGFVLAEKGGARLRGLTAAFVVTTAGMLVSALIVRSQIDPGDAPRLGWASLISLVLLGHLLVFWLILPLLLLGRAPTIFQSLHERRLLHRPIGGLSTHPPDPFREVVPSSLVVLESRRPGEG